MNLEDEITHDLEFYVIVRLLDHWSHYLRLKQFMLHFDYQALKLTEIEPKTCRMG